MARKKKGRRSRGNSAREEPDAGLQLSPTEEETTSLLDAESADPQRPQGDRGDPEADNEDDDRMLLSVAERLLAEGKRAGLPASSTHAPSSSGYRRGYEGPGGHSYEDVFVPGIDDVGGEKRSDEALRARAANSWLVNFDGERYMMEAWRLFRENVASFYIAEFICLCILLIAEIVFRTYWGRSSVDHSHQLTWEGFEYLVQAPTPADIGAPQFEGRGAIKLEHQLLHVLSLYLHRVLLVYPMLASFHQAIFNGMRNSARIVRLGDFFFYMHYRELGGLLGVGSVMFLLSWLLSLRWILLPLWVYYQVATMFVLPLHVEEQTSPRHFLKAFSLSLSMANGHAGYLMWFVAVCYLPALLAQVLGGFAVVVVLGFVPFPLIIGCICFCYHHLFGVDGVRTDLDPMPVA